MTSHTTKFEAMPLMEKDEDWEDPDDLVLGPLNSVLENMKYNSRTVSRSELWKAILFASTLSFVAGVTVPYIFYSLIFHHCIPDTLHVKTVGGISENIFLDIKEDGLKLWQKKLDDINSSALPLYIKEEWQKQGLDSITIIPHKIAFSLPSKKKLNKLHLVRKDIQAEFTDSDSAMDDNSSYIKPLCCASVIETIHPIEGDLVFANFGRYEDFLKLSKVNVDINGKIVIIKYGMVPTASKIILAQKFGAIGVILFPAKPLGIKSIIITNASCNIFLPDETMHSCPVSENSFLFRKIDFSTIPVYPITNEDAEKLLSKLDGPNEPADWSSEESLPHKVGPHFTENYKKIRMEIYSEDVSQTIYSTIGKLNGKMERDRSVVVGSVGRLKNSTGLSILLEMSNIFTKALKNGIRPRRNILFCAWGTEDYFGTHSIDEWIKDYQEYLEAYVAYIDVDTSLLAEYYQLTSTPMLVKEISEAMQKVLDYKEHDVNTLSIGQANSSLNDHIKLRLQLPSVGGYLPFYNILGVPSAHFQHECKSPRSCQYTTDCSSHSCCYDEVSTDFNNIVTLAQIWTKIIHSLSDSVILHLDVTGLAIYLNNSVKKLEGKYRNLLEEHSITMGNLNSTIEEFVIAAEHFQNTLKDTDSKNFYNVRSMNNKLMRIGKSFTDINSSSKKRFRGNLLYAPSNVLVCSMVIFPGITDLLLELSIENNTRQIQICKDLQEEIAAVSSHVKSATKILHDL